MFCYLLFYCFFFVFLFIHVDFHFLVVFYNNGSSTAAAVADFGSEVADTRTELELLKSLEGLNTFTAEKAGHVEYRCSEHMDPQETQGRALKTETQTFESSTRIQKHLQKMQKAAFPFFVWSLASDASSESICLCVPVLEMQRFELTTYRYR